MKASAPHRPSVWLCPAGHRAIWLCWLFWLALTTAWASPARAQTPSPDPLAPTAARPAMETVVRQTMSNGAPGWGYALVSAQGVVLEATGGLADIQDRRPVTPQTQFRLYSVTKTLTALGVLLLAEQGKIQLDGPVAQQLPGFPYSPQVTVRQLLAQTSGLPNPIPLRWVHTPAQHAAFDENGALERVAAANPKLAFEPGSRYGYSNLSYWYLGRLIERASGQPYPEFMAQRVFGPMAITPPELGFTLAPPPERAKGYLYRYSWMNLLKGWVTEAEYFGQYEEGWLEVLPHYPDGPAYGGAAGSLRGLEKLLARLLAPQNGPLKAKSLALMAQPQQTSRGKPSTTSLGWHLDSLDGLAYLYKEGGGAGYHAEIRLYPKRGLASVVLANDTTFDSRQTLSAIDRQLLPLAPNSASDASAAAPQPR